jgi:hypothetical protein
MEDKKEKLAKLAQDREIRNKGAAPVEKVPVAAANGAGAARLG